MSKQRGSVMLRAVVRRMRAAAVCAVLAAGFIPLTGCGNFFVPPNSTSSSGSGSGSSTTGNYAFVANSASGSTFIDGFTLTGSTLVAASGFPVTLDYVPQAMVVNRSNKFLYVAGDLAQSPNNGYIYGYSIGTGGALTILNSGSGLEAEDAVAMDVSPDGQWLFALNADGSTIEEYSINTSTGLLTFAAQYQVVNTNTNLLVTPSDIKVAPTGDFVAVAMGQAGFETFALTTTTGNLTAESQTTPANTGFGAYALGVDANNYLYVGETSHLYVYGVSTTGTYSNTVVSGVSTGTGPYSVALDGTSYVYTGYENTSSSAVIGGFANTSGVLSAGAQYTAPTKVSKIAVDSTGAYLIAAGYDSSSGIQLYTIGSTGAITSSSSLGSGTTATVPIAIAMTH